jgi:hypothetical protein
MPMKMRLQPHQHRPTFPPTVIFARNTSKASKIRNRHQRRPPHDVSVSCTVHYPVLLAILCTLGRRCCWSICNTQIAITPRRIVVGVVIQPRNRCKSLHTVISRKITVSGPCRRSSVLVLVKEDQHGQLLDRLCRSLIPVVVRPTYACVPRDRLGAPLLLLVPRNAQ